MKCRGGILSLIIDIDCANPMAVILRDFIITRKNIPEIDVHAVVQLQAEPFIRFFTPRRKKKGTVLMINPCQSGHRFGDPLESQTTGNIEMG